jgi:hypothetical protein
VVLAYKQMSREKVIARTVKVKENAFARLESLIKYGTIFFLAPVDKNTQLC